MQDDELDLLLLKTKPYDLLIRHQTLFSLITRKYARAGYFPFQDCNEMLQVVNEKFCLHIGRIASQYNGQVLVRTYLSAICRNIIKEYLRSMRRRSLLLRDHMVCEPDFQVPLYARLVILDEFNRLDKIMILMGHKKHKVMLMLKLLYRIKIGWSDLLSYREDARDYISEEVMDRLNCDPNLKDKDIYTLIFPLFATGEGKISHPDTLRKWFNYKTCELIRLLNGSPPRAAYCSDTLQILLEKYCLQVSEGNYIPLYFVKSRDVGFGSVQDFKLTK